MLPTSAGVEPATSWSPVGRPVIDWLVINWELTSWPVTRDRLEMSSCLVGEWSVAGWLVAGWPVYFLGYKYPWSCHLDGSTPGSRAMWGGDPILNIFVWWLRQDLLFLILLSGHNPLPWQINYSLLCKLPDLICPINTSRTCWFPTRRRTTYICHDYPTRLWIIVMRVAKTHYDKQAMNKYKKSINNSQQELRWIVKGMIEEHEKNEGL